MKLKLFVFFFILAFLNVASVAQTREIKDDYYKFSFNLPENWDKKDVKETADKDGISYSFERKDKQCAIMLLAFKISSVKNLEDFIYVMEKDVELNIPNRQGDYAAFDNNTYDGKVANYKDNTTTERIYFIRTKLADAPYNYAYMLRFITNDQFMNQEMDNQIQKIADSFLPSSSLD